MIDFSTIFGDLFDFSLISTDFSTILNFCIFFPGPSGVSGSACGDPCGDPLAAILLSVQPVDDLLYFFIILVGSWFIINFV